MPASDGRYVLDASALLAWLLEEPGAALVDPSNAVINSVNWCEVVQKLASRGGDVEALGAEMEALGLRRLAFSVVEGEAAAALQQVTQHLGLSLGDRACIATAAQLRATALTADREWLEVGKPHRIKAIR